LDDEERKVVKKMVFANISVIDGPMVDQCWLWRGGGQLQYEGKVIGVHRFSYMAFRDDIPEGLWVLHDCDEPGCVNPNHFHLGTQADKEMDEAGRRVQGVRRQITERDRQEIRSRRGAGETILELAHDYGSSEACMKAVLKGGLRRPSQRYHGASWNGYDRMWGAKIEGKYLGAFSFLWDVLICLNYHIAYLGLDRPLNDVNALATWISGWGGPYPHD
jgi:hypothetical protein